MSDDTIRVIDWTGMKRMERPEFLRLAEPEQRQAIENALDAPKSRVRGAVCFQDEDSRSAKYGQRYYLVFGVGLDFADAKTLGALPYRGAGAIAYYEREGEATP